MDTKGVNRCLGGHPLTRPFYLGCYPSDKLPPVLRTPASIVVNEDESDEPGSHWVGIFVKDKRTAYYFDSFGTAPTAMIADYLEQFGRVVSNEKAYQSPETSVCGHYVLYFVYMASLGFNMSMIKCVLDKQFANPDKFVVDFVKRNFFK